MGTEPNRVALESWALVLDSLKDRIGAAKTGDLTGQLAQRMILEWKADNLEALLSAWSPLAGKAEPEKAGQLAAILTRGLTLTPDSRGLDVDFNKLSQVVAPLRPTEAIPLGAVSAAVTSAFFMLAGVVLFFLAWGRRSILTVSP